MTAVWKSIDQAPLEPRTGIRGPIIVGVDAKGLIGRTAFCHEHFKGNQVWLLLSGEGLMEWVPDPLGEQ